MTSGIALQDRPPANSSAQTGPGSIRLRPGHTRQLGARIEADCINFALAAPHAEAVELCLFDPTGRLETARLAMPGQRDGIWHGALMGVAAEARTGLVYGWRVHGPWAPEQGHRFNPAKLLLDPFAREVVGHYGGEDIHLGHDRATAGAYLRPDPRDNAAWALKARVVHDLPPPTVARPAVDAARRVIYELHIKGFTATHPGVPPSLRGTFAGMADPSAIAHIKGLGVTTVCLMPVAHRADEARLLASGLRNYWGYSPIAWSAPEARFWSGRPGTSPRTEFRTLVDALHEAGLEVVLDVVYNHTAETDEFGPTLSLRGIDNALYYHLHSNDRSQYANWTGCGNSVNLNEPLVLRTVMDSLRLWVDEFGVDGFRFDLAPILARGEAQVQGAFQPHSPFLGAIAQDPMLRDRLMIAEPWDIGPGGYQLGAFPPGWLEWNDRFRDTQRALWLQRHGTRGVLACRMAGSADLFQPATRGAHSSINFITAHDGFTLRDLVSYAQRHNQANGEDNRDGHSHNLSANHGVEGNTQDQAVLAARARASRALLAMLMLSLGTPMLLAGDELGHSQRGNNNAYCQDNATTWLDWEQADLSLCTFVQRMVALRQACPLLQSRDWWSGDESSQKPVALWFAASGDPMSPAAWDSGQTHALALKLQQRHADESVLVLLNAAQHPECFHLPPGDWSLELDTSCDIGLPRREWLGAHETLEAGSVWIALSKART